MNGHLASVYRMTVQSQKHGGKRYDVSSDAAFADIPVRFWITSKGDYNGTLVIRVTLTSCPVTKSWPQ